MSELEETVQEAVEHGKESKLNSAVAAVVTVTATFMALCNVKDGNIVQAMQQAQARSVDQWSYYQAKGTKQNLSEQTLDQLSLQRDLAHDAAPEARAKLEQKIQEYAAKSKNYEKEKAQIKQAAEDAEKEYDRLNLHDDQFDAADACLSIAIALFGVTALTQKRWLMLVGLGFAAFGFLFGGAGFLGLGFHPDFLARVFG
jgi:hypothetical protein